MGNAGFTAADEVDQLLLNARLRDELEPFLDESIRLVNTHTVPTPVENEYLASMLAWERAPVLPIADWFVPRLELPPPDQLSPDRLHAVLWETIGQLFQRRIVVEFTDHLSDHALYCLIIRDILPSPEKRIEQSPTYLHWHCLDPQDDPELWLRYYASADEREAWAAESNLPLPPAEAAPFPRQLPRSGR